MEPNNLPLRQTYLNQDDVEDVNGSSGNTFSLSSSLKIQDEDIEKDDDEVTERVNIVDNAINEGEDVINNDEQEDKTPTIPQEVYDNLPSLLKGATDVFDKERERDILLTGAITGISGCLTNISGSYDGGELYPNLNCLIVAPPASGKSRMKFAATLITPLHNELLNQYKAEVKNYAAQKKSKQNGVVISPILQTLFIAGNSSAAAIIKQLDANNGKGVIFETEADTLGNALKQDWGVSFSEVIRCSYHQESIRFARATEMVNIDIPKPKLAIALSGTPNQVQPLISSIHNGLFSRFLYYTFKGDNKLKLIGKHVNGKNLTVHFEQLSVELCKFLTLRENNVYQFEFTDQQFKKSYDFFLPCYNEIRVFVGEDFDNVIFRLGVMLYKICMILATLREYDKSTDVNGLIICSDIDFEIGLKMIETYMHHSLVVFKSMLKPSIQNHITKKEKFLSLLPNGEFGWKQAASLNIEVGIGVRTLKTWLDELIANGLIKKGSHGFYEKVSK